MNKINIQSKPNKPKQLSGVSIASEQMEQANKWSKQTNGASEQMEQANKWNKRTNGASEQMEQASGLLEMRQDTRPENEREREIHYNMYY